MNRLLPILLLTAVSLAGCVDVVTDTPEPTRFEALSLDAFHASGSHVRSDGLGYVFYGAWREDARVSPAVVWLDADGRLCETCGGGVWRGPASAAQDDVFDGITSITRGEEGWVAVQSRRRTGGETQNTIWSLTDTGVLRTEFGDSGRVTLEVLGGTLGLARSDSGWWLPRTEYEAGGLRRVVVDHIATNGDFESGLESIDDVDELAHGQCGSSCDSGFAGGLDMVHDADGTFYLVGQRVVSFVLEQPAIARVDSGEWNRDWGEDGFETLEDLSEGDWRVVGSAARGDEIGHLLFPPPHSRESYRFVSIDVTTGERAQRWSIEHPGLDDPHVGLIEAHADGWWFVGIDLRDRWDYPVFVLKVGADGTPDSSFGDSGLAFVDVAGTVKTAASNADELIVAIRQDSPETTRFLRVLSDGAVEDVETPERQ